MNNPPPIPNRKPLGQAFFILLFAPIGVMALGAGLAFINYKELGDYGMFLSWVAMLAMLVCSIFCAVMAGQRWGGWLGVLMFLGIQVLYIGVSVAGCATVLAGANLH